MPPSADRSRRPNALVTGASSDIGGATARRLAQEGYFVYCVARHWDSCDSLAREIAGKGISCDITLDDDVERLAKEVDVPLDLLVNNAGAAFGLGTVAESSAQDWRKMYELDVVGPLRVIRHLLPALEASGDAVIINLGSTAGHEVFVRAGGYVASKHALAQLTRQLRRELLGRPIRVVEVAPEIVETENFTMSTCGDEVANSDTDYAAVEAVLSAADVAECIAWAATRPSHVNIDLMKVRARSSIMP